MLITDYNDVIFIEIHFHWNLFSLGFIFIEIHFMTNLNF